jgi:type I restriction enzyme S subunit
VVNIAHKKNQLVPVLRFKAFDTAWETKRLGEVFSIFNGYAFSSNDAKEVGCRWVKIADVGINEINHDSTSYLPDDYREKYSKFLLREGDYVVALTRPILGGKLKIAKIDKALDRSLLNQRVGKLVSHNDLDFVYSLLQKESVVARIEKRIAGTDPPNLAPGEIDTLSQFIPSHPEQQKIASFLSAVDQKIRLLARKQKLLEQYKKGVMQQLFSGKRRFKDENGKAYPKWEEKKLGEVAKFHKGRGILKNDIDKEGVLECIRYGELYTTYSELIDHVISKTNLPAKDLFLSEYNDVIIPSSGETQDEIATASCVLKSGVALGGDLNVIRSPLNGIFLSLYLNHEKKYDIAKLAQGSSVVHLYSSQLQNLRLNLPCLGEQGKIASYLSSIKTKIENVTTQITQTQTFKKGLLQQMFV